MKVNLIAQLGTFADIPGDVLEVYIDVSRFGKSLDVLIKTIYAKVNFLFVSP